MNVKQIKQYLSENGKPNTKSKTINKIVLEVSKFFKDVLKLDISNRKIKDEIRAVAEYIEEVRNNYIDGGMDGESYTMDAWYSETLENYPEFIEELRDISDNDLDIDMDEW